MRRVYSSLSLISPVGLRFSSETQRSLLRCSSYGNKNISNALNRVTQENHSNPELATIYFNQFPNYCQMITEAKSRARRSILIDHCGFDHIDMRTEFNNVEQVYSIERETKRGIMRLSLIEFNSQNDAENMARQARHIDGLLPVPLKIFRYSGQASIPHPSKQGLPFPIETIRLTHRKELTSSLESYYDLISSNMMTLVALKMRFITLVNLERILCAGIFSEYELMPFGSSVIDIGSDRGDLDLVVTRKEEHDKVITDFLSSQKNPVKSQDSTSRLLHLDKSLHTDYRDGSGIKGAMKWFDNILRDYMPLTDGNSVLFVPHAKVPIIRFTARVTSIDCDLSFNLGLDYRERDLLTTNYSGIMMSQILYAVCRHSNLFTAAVIYFRIFGKLTSITSKGPNVGFTNFQLLSLVIFYLQQISIIQLQSTVSSREPILDISFQRSTRNKPIIPPFRDILESDHSITHDVPKMHLDNEQLNQLLPKLINGLLRYYSKFDFTNSSINLYNSKIEKKLDNSPLYVVNPLDRSRNICHNVCRKGLDNFIKQCRQPKELQKCPLEMIQTLINKYQQQSKGWRSIDLLNE